LSAERAPHDIAALARGGRTNFIGFLLRLAARLPFLFIAGQLYGAELLGRFAYALVAIELASQLATLGQKRGLAQQLSNAEQPDTHVVADGMVLSLITGGLLTLLLMAVPILMFPSGRYSEFDLLLPLSIIPFALTEIALAALAYRYDVGSTVKARSVVEPWVLSIAAAGLFFVAVEGGLSLAYIFSIFAAACAALYPLVKAYGLPRGWLPHPGRIWRLAAGNLPLATADMVEWGTRRIDIAILGLFASPSAVGIYWAAQQVASLPQKLKTSFEPILGPVITRKLKDGDYPAIARQVCQVGFWIVAMQAGIALALGMTGEAVMGLIGRGGSFVGGTGALIFLLVAEVVAGTAVVAEAALIYVARFRNFAVSLGTIALQGSLTIIAMLLVGKYGMSDSWRAAGAAVALMLALGIASLVKAAMLSRILGQSVNNWRWALVWAMAPAVIVGWFVTRYTPEWFELAVGIPMILAVYGLVIWRRGFGPEDRLLFRRNLATGQGDQKPILNGETR